MVVVVVLECVVLGLILLKENFKKCIFFFLASIASLDLSGVAHTPIHAPSSFTVSDGQ